MLSAPQGIDASRLFSPFDFASRDALIAAVSGGSDSTALLLLLKQHLDRFSPATRLIAVTIDHALRPESADEAAAVAQLCDQLGVAHRILKWTGDKPATGLAAAAREARHELLAGAAAADDTDLVLTGHTADDQAETVLMRQLEGRVWFARPLLVVRRETLRGFLRQRKVRWIDDPTNLNQQYERPRIRSKLGAEDGEATTAEALRTAAASARRRETLGGDAACLIREQADRPAPGLLRLQPGLVQDKNVDGVIYALRILLAVTGGTPHLPDEARTAALHARLATGKSVRTVLSRTLVDQRKAGVFLLREARGLPPASQAGVWDGRYRIVAGSARSERRSPAIDDTAPAIAEAGERHVPKSLARLAAGGLPELAMGWSAVPILAPWARYLPSFDLAPARAVAELIGAPRIPAPPFQEHD